MSEVKTEHTADSVGRGMSKEEPSPPVMTIGHSTRTLAEFIRLLRAHGATCVVDVRTVPRSRHNPQFNKASLPRSLKKASLGYVHTPGLGGMRHAKHDSPNGGWRNASFRGYADYMQTPEFAQSLEELIRLAAEDRTVLMCAEAVPWRCHRSLIADALLVRGIHRGHHECNSPSGAYPDAFCRSSRHRDHLSDRGFREHEKEAVGQTLLGAARREDRT